MLVVGNSSFLYSSWTVIMKDFCCSYYIHLKSFLSLFNKIKIIPIQPWTFEIITILDWLFYFFPNISLVSPRLSSLREIYIIQPNFCPFLFTELVHEFIFDFVLNHGRLLTLLIISPYPFDIVFHSPPFNYYMKVICIHIYYPYPFKPWFLFY